MLHWLTLLALFGNTLALGLYDDIDDYHLWRRGVPSVTTDIHDKECIKDLLVLWDNSNSINTDGFKDKVVPFLKKFIKSPELQVGRDGTNIGFITFSSEQRTKPLLKIGNITEPDDLETWLDGLDYYKKLSGQSTYMGKAFKLANDEFPDKNPLNHRAEYADVVLLFTDGNPQGYRGNRRKTQEQKDLVVKYSALLRNRGVKIIGMAVETGGKLDKTFIADLSTDGKVISATLDNLDNVLRELVAETCGKVAKGECLCTKTITPFTIYAGPGQKSAKVSWPVPGAQTEKGNACDAVPDSVHPAGSEPGNQYPVKHHVITYKFSNGDAKKPKFTNCVVEFTVASCSCPASQTVKKQVPDGARTVSVSWNEPEPDCPTSPNPENPGTSESFSVGQYTRTYRYTYNLPGRDSFELTCHVTIMITGKMCGETAFDPAEKECCCGDVFVKKDRHECCGKKYINTDKEKCCNSKRANVVPAGGNCP